MFVPSIAEPSEGLEKKVMRSGSLSSMSTIVVAELEIGHTKVRIASGAEFETIQAFIGTLQASSL
jgi:hypothetical protein